MKWKIVQKFKLSKICDYLSKIIETIKRHSGQSLALRGHNECKTLDNRGNFLELLKLRGKTNRYLMMIRDIVIKCKNLN